jgi:hypothetical protein
MVVVAAGIQQEAVWKNTRQVYGERVAVAALQRMRRERSPRGAQATMKIS